MKKHKTSRRRKMLKRRIISLTIFGVIIGLFLYTPIKIKHFSLLHSEAEASERFSLQMEAINDYKSIKESFNNIYTTDEKINEINKFIENIEKNLSEGITEELESLISNLKSKINELSASNQIELENMFNDINEDNLKGFSEEEMNKVNELTDEYNQLFSEKKYKQAKETLNSLINYINETKKVANERRIKETYEEKSNEDASLREPKYINGILIVNKEFGLPDSFAPGEGAEARRAFENMKADAANEGIYLNAFSTYRSYWSQNRLYWNYVSNYGQDPTDTFSAKPGFSEHQTGLAFDIGGVDRSLWAEEDFKYTDEAKWLKDNSYKYGFILRYPEGKEWKTGYMHESWHFRYIGVDHSKNFKDSDLTLEEYLGL
ncbi:D-alanyl-D-alanine carboxypeptidase family protein [Clostridium tertium]|uniref:D-alanyl-D-alanine carboxypeptidase family protein n=1 Tax=Clostridium tertium TaxID=1559 RepID=UPI00232F1C1F|nr:D-alanyl-D-alanine carboxypeptidase family protein [Clostridium tertium]MDB1933275.1 D-alanyl-D-alanine carboxypeptidase family protein [Clostridium tertium]MDB1938486.1 D-alanyl-D-alanine carboxypeptidase family protein [Clostridium tertium]